MKLFVCTLVFALQETAECKIKYAVACEIMFH